MIPFKFSLLSRKASLLVLPLAGLIGSASAASAQYTMQGVATGLRGNAGLVPVAPAFSGVGYYGSFPDPYGGYLSGAANVINAQGGYLKDTQQAYLMAEQVKQAKLQTKRAAFDEWMYEKANTPTLEEQREQERIANLQRSMNNPPPTEIWSGKALNDLLQNLQIMGPAAASGPIVYINQELLKQINVTNGATTAGAGVLKNGGALQWPLAIAGDDRYADTRKQVQDLSAQAVKQAESGAVNPKTLNDLIAAVNKLSAELKDNAANTEPNQYIRAKRYLNDLNASLNTLQQPNASNYFSKQWTAQGNTVSELVAYMTSQGLKFAPAAPGEEAAYNMLQRMLADYQRSCMAHSGK
jgi:hypothetical protein